MPGRPMPAEPISASGRDDRSSAVGVRRVLLVGAFRSIQPEGMDSPYGSQGGFVDSLAPAPYSLATGCLMAAARADPDLCERYSFELMNLSEPLGLDDSREEVRLGSANLQRLIGAEADVVAFSAYCWNIEAVCAAAAALRQMQPDVTLLLGGRATDGDPAQLMRDNPAFDALILGEGEMPFCELLRRPRDRWGGVPGVLYRRGEEILSGGPPVPVADLDQLPSPLLTTAITPPPHGVMLELARGCIHACGYCTWNAAKALRFFGAARLEAEIRQVHARGHRHVTIVDSAINYDTDRLATAVAAIRRADPDGAIQFTYNIRHDSLTGEQLEILSELPTHMVLLGIETFSGAALATSDRSELDRAALRQTLADIAAAIRPPVVSIVLGLPDDTPAGFRRTLDTLLGWTEPPVAVGTVLVSLLQVYPGSTLWHRRGELGLRFCDTGIPYLLESPTWSRSELAAVKADLVRRMRADPHKLKATEAIVLMESEGGLDPRLDPRSVGALLYPWRPGRTVAGWTLESIGMRRDTGDSSLLRFRWRGGGELLVELQTRDAAPSATAPAGFAIRLRPVDDATAPPEARDYLERLVHASLRRGQWINGRRTAQPGRTP